MSLLPGPLILLPMVPDEVQISLALYHVRHNSSKLPLGYKILLQNFSPNHEWIIRTVVVLKNSLNFHKMNGCHYPLVPVIVMPLFLMPYFIFSEMQWLQHFVGVENLKCPRTILLLSIPLHLISFNVKWGL